MTPTNTELAEALRSIEGLPLGTQLVVRLAAERLSPEVADRDEWIKWSGGLCPVPGHVNVECQFDLDPKGPEQGIAHTWRWEHISNWRNIIAYRVIR